MLPSGLVGTYQWYKQDTDSIAAWLASTAKSVGFPPDLLSPTSAPKPSAAGGGGRLKGKARKEAKKRLDSQPPSKPPARFIIAVKDFTTLAEYVASKSIVVPGVFIQTIDRVITTRSGFGAQLQEHGQKLREQSIASHMHFVGVLEKVREVLKPLVTDKLVQATPDAAGDWGNRFASLTVDEPSLEFLNAPDVERPVKVQNDQATYESEPLSLFEDAIFALTILVNDMNRVRAHLRWVWSTYRDGFDLAAAAITTNTAIDLVRNMMEDVLPLLKPHGGLGRMLERFHILQWLMKGRDLSDIAIAQGDGKYAMCMDTYDSDTYHMVYEQLDSLRRVLQPTGLPLYKEGMFGYYDPKSDWGRKSGQEKFEDDRALLMPFFTEQMTAIRCVADWPVKDEFMRGIEEMDKTQTVPFYAVFAAQVFLDVTYELGENIQAPFATLVANTTFIENDIKGHFEFHANLRIAHWPPSNDQFMRQLQQLIKRIGRDVLRPLQVELLESMGMEAPEIESHRIFRMSPVISGLFLYHFRARYHDIGISVANAWGSIQYCEHLYNTLKHQKLAEGLWEDMDVLYTNLGADSFFVGGEEPRTLDDSFKKFSLQMGTSAAAMSIRRRQSTSLFSRAGPRGLKEVSPVQSMFVARYVENSGQVDLTPDHVNQIIELSLFEQERSESDNTFILAQVEDPEKLKEKKKRWQNQQQGRPQKQKAVDAGRLAPDQLIRPLVLALHAETLEFSFPYLTMHRWCWRVLRAVKDACDSVLRELYTAKYIERETELPFVVGWILMAASKLDGGISDLRPLRAAADAFNVFLETGMGDFVCTRVLGEKLAMPIQFETEGEDVD